MTDFWRLPSEETAESLLGLYDTIAWQNKFIETHLLGNILKLGCICLSGIQQSLRIYAETRTIQLD